LSPPRTVSSHAGSRPARRPSAEAFASHITSNYVFYG
jgi:hypothetical protein